MHIMEEEQMRVTLFIIGEHVYGSRLQLSLYDSVSQTTCSRLPTTVLRMRLEIISAILSIAR
jgi:hypothetical protein